MWQGEQQLVCRSCGTSEWEWAEDENAWWPDTHRCPGCERIDAFKRELRQHLQWAPPSDEDGLEIRFYREPRDTTTAREE